MSNGVATGHAEVVATGAVREGTNASAEWTKRFAVNREDRPLQISVSFTKSLDRGRTVRRPAAESPVSRAPKNGGRRNARPGPARRAVPAEKPHPFGRISRASCSGASAGVHPKGERRGNYFETVPPKVTFVPIAFQMRPGGS